MLDPKKKPCDECPFRRKSLPGYTGSATPQAFIAAAGTGQIAMPCHVEVDYEAADWEEQQELVHQCTGHAIFLTNTCCLPRDPAIKRLPADHKKFFSHAHQFLEHHGTRED